MAAMTRYDPFTRTSLALREMMNRLLDEAFVPREWFEEGSGAETGMSLYETRDAYLAYVPAPGLRPQDLEVIMQGGDVIIRGTRRFQVPEEAKPLIVGMRAGAIKKRFRLPGDIDLDKVEARLQDGILELRLPKPAVTRPQRIPVNVA